MANWFYLRDGERLGPYTYRHVRRLALSGRLSPHDPVWRDGMGRWVPAGVVRGLFGPVRAHSHRRPIDPLFWDPSTRRRSSSGADYDPSGRDLPPAVSWAGFVRLVVALTLALAAVVVGIDIVTPAVAPGTPVVDDPTAGMYIVHDPATAPVPRPGSKP
jgi:hypothetical protein